MYRYFVDVGALVHDGVSGVSPRQTRRKVSQ